MKTIFRASALAAMLMSGAALSAWAALPADSQGNTAPSSAGTYGSSSGMTGTAMAPGTTTTPGTATAPGYHTSQSSTWNSNGNPASAAPSINSGNAQGAAGGGAGAGAR